jgi:hypothetical protein
VAWQKNGAEHRTIAASDVSPGFRDACKHTNRFPQNADASVDATILSRHSGAFASTPRAPTGLSELHYAIAASLSPEYSGAAGGATCVRILPRRSVGFAPEGRDMRPACPHGFGIQVVRHGTADDCGPYLADGLRRTRSRHCLYHQAKRALKARFHTSPWPTAWVINPVFHKRAESPIHFCPRPHLKNQQPTINNRKCIFLPNSYEIVRL